MKTLNKNSMQKVFVTKGVTTTQVFVVEEAEKFCRRKKAAKRFVVKRKCSFVFYFILPLGLFRAFILDVRSAVFFRTLLTGTTVASSKV